MLNLNDRDVLHEINMSKITGLYAPTPFYEIDAEEEEITTDVRKWMKELNAPMIYKSVEELDDFITRLNNHIETNDSVQDMSLKMPYNEELNYLIGFSTNIVIHVYLIDEYIGNGEYNMEGGIPGLLITKDVLYEEVKQVVEFFRALDAYFITGDCEGHGGNSMNFNISLLDHLKIIGFEI